MTIRPATLRTLLLTCLCSLFFAFAVSIPALAQDKEFRILGTVTGASPLADSHMDASFYLVEMGIVKEEVLNDLFFIFMMSDIESLSVRSSVDGVVEVFEDRGETLFYTVVLQPEAQDIYLTAPGYADKRIKPSQIEAGWFESFNIRTAPREEAPVASNDAGGVDTDDAFAGSLFDESSRGGEARGAGAGAVQQAERARAAQEAERQRGIQQRRAEEERERQREEEEWAREQERREREANEVPSHINTELKVTENTWAADAARAIQAAGAAAQQQRDELRRQNERIAREAERQRRQEERRQAERERREQTAAQQQAEAQRQAEERRQAEAQRQAEERRQAEAQRQAEERRQQQGRQQGSIFEESPRTGPTLSTSTDDSAERQAERQRALAEAEQRSEQEEARRQAMLRACRENNTEGRVCVFQEGRNATRVENALQQARQRFDDLLSSKVYRVTGVEDELYQLSQAGGSTGPLPHSPSVCPRVAHPNNPDTTVPTLIESYNWSDVRCEVFDTAAQRTVCVAQLNYECSTRGIPAVGR